MDNGWKSYFSFTKKERTGILTLLLLIGISTLVPYVWPDESVPDAVAQQALNARRARIAAVLADTVDEVETLADSKNTVRRQVELFRFNPNTLDADGWRRLGIADKTIRTVQNYLRRGGQFRKAEDLKRIYGFAEADFDRLVSFIDIRASKQVELFKFDPNTIDAEGWKRLGVSDRNIRTIENYIQKGGRFRKPEDLKKMYGIRPEDYERLAPYITIPVMEQRKTPYVKTAPTVIEINTADTATFIDLPGIGPALAKRIITFREKLGGFYSVEQVAETYGLPDSTFQLIKGRLECTPGTLRKININAADAATLKQHPYMKWAIANAIVQYRQQHGPYKSIEEVRQIVLVTPELYKKVTPYLAVE